MKSVNRLSLDDRLMYITISFKPISKSVSDTMAMLQRSNIHVPLNSFSGCYLRAEKKELKSNNSNRWR